MLRRNKHALALILVLAVLNTACPKESQIQKAANASQELAAHTRTAIATTAALFKNGMISLERKDQIASHLAAIARNGAAFNTLVIDTRAKFGDKLAADQWAFLAQNFDQITVPFIQLLNDINLLDLAASKEMRLAIALLRAAIVTIASVLSPANASLDRHLRQIERLA